MKTRLLVIAALLFAGTADASPKRSQPSQHPRVGELAEVHFRLGSSDVPHNVAQDLGEVAAWAKDNPEGLVVLNGHADRRGEGPGNVKLSLRRAQAVRDELIELGVDPDLIVIAAFGSDAPQRPKTADNRRVTIWGTHQDIQTVARTTLKRGTAVLWSQLLTTRQQKPIVSRR